MTHIKNNSLSRREFIKRIGMGTASAAIMVGMGPLVSIGKDDDQPTLVNGMTYRVNRKTGDKVSLLGFGMMRLPFKDGDIDQDLVNKEVSHALKHGVNYFDTSPHYVNDKSESSLGIALKASGVSRKDYYIATKLSNFGQREWSREESEKLYRRSFEHLQTDYIDYYLLHSIGQGGMESLNGRFIDNGMLDFLLEERKAGRIRNLGFSYHGDVRVFDYLLANNDKYKWDFVQIEMNYVDWKHADEVNKRNTKAEYLYTQLENHDIQAVIMEPLFGGRLAKLPDVYARQLKQLRPDDSLASWAFRFCGTYPNVLTSLSGMTYMEHLEDNLKTHSPLDPCSKSELALLEDIATNLATYPIIPCTDCKYCMPCPYGVNIPGNFAFYNACVNDGTLPPTDPNANGFKKKNAKFQKAYKKALPESQLASQCVECGECLKKCPQRIPIPTRMGRLTDLLDRK